MDQQPDMVQAPDTAGPWAYCRIFGFQIFNGSVFGRSGRGSARKCHGAARSFLFASVELFVKARLILGAMAAYGLRVVPGLLRHAAATGVGRNKRFFSG